MLWLIIVLVVAVIGVFWYKRMKSVDQPLSLETDAVAAKVQVIKQEVKSALDANKDGVVNAADVAVVEEKVKETAKKTVAKAKTAVKKTKTTKLKVAK